LEYRNHTSRDDYRKDDTAAFVAMFKKQG